MALTDNLEAYYKLDESSGNAADASCHGRTLTNNNTVAFAAGLINNCADFGSSNTNKSFSLASGMGITTNYSFSVWVKIQTEPASGEVQTFIYNGTAAGAVVNCLGYQNSGGTKRLLFLRNRSGVAGDVAYHNVNLGTSDWHHLAMTYNGTTVKGYLDNAEVVSFSSSGTGTSATDLFVLGESTATSDLLATDYGTNGFPKCYMDEVAIFSRAISAGDVTTLYNAGAGKAYPLSYTEVVINAVGSLANQTGSSFNVPLNITDNTSGYLIAEASWSGLNGNSLTSVTWNGDNLTKIHDIQESGIDRRIEQWYMLTPDVANTNVVFTMSASVGGEANFSVRAYTGAKQSSQPDASGETANASAGTTVTQSITTVTDNCLIVATSTDGAASNPVPAAGSFFRQSVYNRVGNGYELFALENSAVKATAGSVSIGYTHSSSRSLIIASAIAPAPATAAGSNFLGLLGVN